MVSQGRYHHHHRRRLLPPVPDRAKVRNLPLELHELDALVVTKATPKRVR